VEHTGATGNGPLNALDNGIHRALEKFYPKLNDMNCWARRRGSFLRTRALDRRDGCSLNPETIGTNGER
jgi:hypothetical protein